MWDYPWPPRLEALSECIEIWLGDVRIASTSASFRVLETSHPPTYYLPWQAFVAGSLVPAAGSRCANGRAPRPTSTSSAGGAGRAQRLGLPASHAGVHRAGRSRRRLYPAAMQRCTVEGEVVQPQPGTFYGGWVTSKIAGPFKGVPGGTGW